MIARPPYEFPVPVPFKSQTSQNDTRGLPPLMGSLLFSCFDSRTFWVHPLTYFYIPKSAWAYLFSQSVKIHCFCSGPLALTPFVRNHCFPGLPAPPPPEEVSAGDPGREEAAPPRLGLQRTNKHEQENKLTCAGEK